MTQKPRNGLPWSMVIGIPAFILTWTGIVLLVAFLWFVK